MVHIHGAVACGAPAGNIRLLVHIEHEVPCQRAYKPVVEHIDHHLAHIARQAYHQVAAVVPFADRRLGEEEFTVRILSGLGCYIVYGSAIVVPAGADHQISAVEVLAYPVEYLEGIVHLAGIVVVIVIVVVDVDLGSQTGLVEIRSKIVLDEIGHFLPSHP